MIRSAIAVFFVATVGIANAQAAQPAKSAQAAIPPAKQQLIQKIVELLHFDSLGVAMLQDPVGKTIGQARVTLQARAPADRHEAAMKDIATEAKKFMDEATPIVKGAAQKHIPSTVVPLLAEKFTEDELRQLVAILESPVKNKFEELVPEMKKALGEKLAADTGAVINPKMEDLTQRVGLRLRTAVAP